MRLPREWTIVGVLTINLAAALALGLPHASFGECF